VSSMRWTWEPVSLCPAAPGWWAVYDSDTEPWWMSEPLPLWGIYREYNFYDRTETGDSDIFGVVRYGPSLYRASDAGNFWCYGKPGCRVSTPHEHQLDFPVSHLARGGCLERRSDAWPSNRSMRQAGPRPGSR
jgi:hypothetical protein